MTNTKTFKELTIAEKFEAIAKVVEVQNQEFADFLKERAELQVKANSKPRKASETSSKLQEAIKSILEGEGRVMAEQVEAKLIGIGYTDEHKQGLTIARVRAGLSALAKEGVVAKFDADRKKDAQFPKVSYMLNDAVE